MKRPNVLIIGNYPPPYGGVPHHIERLAGHLVENGWICHVLSGGASGYETDGKLHVYKPNYSIKATAILRQLFGKSLHYWLRPRALIFSETKLWIRYLIYASVGEEIIRKNDIQVIVTYNVLSYGPVGSYLSEKFDIPHIINIFGEVYKHQSMLKCRKFFSGILSSSCCLLSCSSHCGNSIKKLGVNQAVETVTYGINTNHFRPGVCENLRKYLKIGNEKVVLFVGRLSKEMGLDSFMAAAQLNTTQFPTVRFIMVGQPGDLLDEVKQQCKALSGQFLIITSVPYVDLPYYYRLASVVVVPSRGDRTCSSLAAMEAMATRKAVVGYAIGGIPEIILNEVNGLLVEPENVQDLARAISRLLQDENLSDRLAHSAYLQAQSVFDENLVNIKMEQHILKALNNA